MSMLLSVVELNFAKRSYRNFLDTRETGASSSEEIDYDMEYSRLTLKRDAIECARSRTQAIDRAFCSKRHRCSD